MGQEDPLPRLTGKIGSMFCSEGFVDLCGFRWMGIWCPGEDSNLHGRKGH